MSTPTTSAGASGGTEPSGGPVPNEPPANSEYEPSGETTDETTIQASDERGAEPVAEPAVGPSVEPADGPSVGASARASAEPAAEAFAEPSGPSSEPAPGHGRREVIGALVLLTIVVGLVLTAFALPAIKSAPRNVPIGVAGPAQVATQVDSALEQRAPGAFDVTAYPDEAALTAAIRNRDVYGGISVTPQGATMLTAPAGSPAVAQLLTAVALGLSQQTGQQVPVKEVVPLPAGDPRGAGLASAILPLLIGSVIPVLAMIRLVKNPWRRLAGVLTASVLIGMTVAGLLHWYGAFTGPWVRESLAIAAVMAATSTALLGLFTVGRWVGFGLGVATFVLLGNPLSGIATAPQFLPAFWATLGSLLPPGAAGQVVRSASYFDGAGATHGLIVLGAWFLLGVALVAVGSRRHEAVPAAA